MNEAQRDVALFRYSLIREASDATLSTRQRGQLVRELASQDHVGPGNRRVRVARGTIDRWARAYRAGGFEALVPVSRSGEPVTEKRLLDLAEALKREVPRRTAAQVAEIIRTSQGAGPAARTLQRHFARLGLNTRPDGSAPQAFGRFEAAAPRGPVDRRCPARAGHRRAQDLPFCLHRRPLASPGRLSLGAVRGHCPPGSGVPRRPGGTGRAPLGLLGQRICHGQPSIVAGVRQPRGPASALQARTTPGRGKIERFFETVRAQFLVEVEARPPANLAELNRLFSAWVETVYHRRAHSETGEAPIERLLAGGAPALPSPAALHEAFLWSEARTVTKVATVSLHGNTFEVDAALVGSRVEVVFDPFAMEAVEVRFQGRPMGQGLPVVIGRHSHPQARAEAAPAPAPTGIDYLGLLASRRDAELARAINYAQLTLPGAGEPESTTDQKSAHTNENKEI